MNDKQIAKFITDDMITDFCFMGINRDIRPIISYGHCLEIMKNAAWELLDVSFDERSCTGQRVKFYLAAIYIFLHAGDIDNAKFFLKDLYELKHLVKPNMELVEKHIKWIEQHIDFLNGSKEMLHYVWRDRPTDPEKEQINE